MHRTTNSGRRGTRLLLAAALPLACLTGALTACSDGDTTPAATRPERAAEETFASGGPDGSAYMPPPAPAAEEDGASGGDGAASAPAKAAPKAPPGVEEILDERGSDPVRGLSLHATVPDDEVRWGEPLEVQLTLRNTGAEPVRFLDLEGDLVRRLTVRLRDAGREYHLTSGIPPEPGARAEPYELPAGMERTFSFDVTPILRRTQSYGIGTLRFFLAWSGSPSVGPTGSDAWNADPQHSLRTRELRASIELPEWLESAGADAEIVVGTDDAMLRWTPGARPDEEIRAKVDPLGAAGIASLAFCAARLEQTGAWADGRAANALRMLRMIGFSALPVLAKAPRTPTVATISAILTEDASAEPSATGPAAAFRTLASGTEDATALVVLIHERKGEPGPIEMRFDRDGSLWTVRDAAATAPQALRRNPDLVTTTTLKRAVLRAKPWTWQPFREERRADEGVVTFTLLRGTDVLWTIRLREQEAADGNPFAADLFGALCEACAVDRRPKVDDPAAPPGAKESRR